MGRWRSHLSCKIGAHSTCAILACRQRMALWAAGRRSSQGLAPWWCAGMDLHMRHFSEYALTQSAGHVQLPDGFTAKVLAILLRDAWSQQLFRGGFYTVCMLCSHTVTT